MFVDYIFEWLCFFLTILCLISIFVQLKHRKKTILKNSQELTIVDFELGLSVVICIKGAAERFPSYFEKIISQQYSQVEYILICHEIAEKIQLYIDEKLSQNNFVFQFLIDEKIHPYSEKKQALNLGVSLAKYDYIVTIDDDCYPENDTWLDSINQHIQSKKSDILLGLSPYISQGGVLNQWIRYDAYQVAENLCYFTLREIPYMGIGRNMVFKKSLWSTEYLETYKDRGSGDDSHLVQYYTENKKIDLMISPLIYSFPKLSFKYWFFQKIRHIKSGNNLTKSQLFNLSIMPFISLIFWISIWIWSSFLNFHLMIFGLIFIYFGIKLSFQVSISKKINFKLKPIFYSIIFEFWYNLSFFILPIFAQFVKRKW